MKARGKVVAAVIGVALVAGAVAVLALPIHHSYSATMTGINVASLTVPSSSGVDISVDWTSDHDLRTAVSVLNGSQPLTASEVASSFGTSGELHFTTTGGGFWLFDATDSAGISYTVTYSVPFASF